MKRTQITSVLAAGLLALVVPFAASAETTDFGSDVTSGTDDAPAIIIGRGMPRVKTGRHWIGYGVLITNDLIGDGHDRWNTGSVAASHVWGHDWTGRLPSTPGELLELRVNGAIYTPSDLGGRANWDRRYANELSFGLHTQFERAGLETSIGANLVFTGKQTGLTWFQTQLHELISAPTPSDKIIDSQIPNGVHPTLVGETGHTYDLGAVTVRPFVEGRWGDESLARVGFDLVWGKFGRGDLMARDPISGWRYRAIRHRRSAVSFLMGGDVAHVWDSIYLPGDDKDPAVEPTRVRLRAGVDWENPGFSTFYGLTWLGRQYEGQPTGQLVGSLQFMMNF